MDRFRIIGGKPLEGTVRIGGAKNAALPAMAAALLTTEPVHLRNIPRVRDIITMSKVIAHTSVHVETADLPPTDLTIQAQTITDAEAPYDLVRTMRASILMLGPLVARKGYARVSLPGGCAIGARPVDLHIKALAQMGADITTEGGYVIARVPSGRLHGTDIRFEKITVTGTENILMAAALASGETRIANAAREPEVTDLAELLIKMGARIDGVGTSTLTIQGVDRLGGASHTIIPDRIETGTFVIAGAICGGGIRVANCNPEHLRAVLAKLCEMGVDIEPEGESVLRVSGTRNLRAVNVTTEEYPGFATDMQAQLMALATQAQGSSEFIETIFENRFMHASEMIRMGADITIDGRKAIVRGPTQLEGATVIASDLRASASLVIAALVARGETTIDRVYHIDRGYERIEEKLSQLGAQIERLR